MVAAIPIAVGVLREEAPQAAAEPVPEPAAEPVPAAVGEPVVAVAAAADRPALTVNYLPAPIANPCEEAGLRVTVGCGGCTATHRAEA